MSNSKVTLNPGVGGVDIGVDIPTTVNGVASSNIDIQRVKTGYGSDGTYRDVDATHPLPVEKQHGTIATRTAVTATADAVILAATARLSVTFSNDSDQDFLLGTGTTTVTATSKSFRIRPGGAVSVDGFDGAFRGYFVSAPSGSGQLDITEIT